MTTPKSPEEILTEALPRYRHFDAGLSTPSEMQEFLRSSMASLLCYMAERMPKHEEGYPDPYSEETDNSSDGFNRAIDDCRTLLIEEARKISEV